MTWARFFDNPQSRRVKHVKIFRTRISTVFLGLDHSWGDGPPLLFETMIFGGKHDGYKTRCSTWAEALEMHKKACLIVLGLACSE